MDISTWHCPASFEAPDTVVVETPVEDNHGAVLREFLATHYTRLHQRLLRHLGCPDLASDCLHDAWLRLGEMNVSEPVQSPEAYVYRVACNVAMDRLRGNRSSQYTDEAVLEHLADPAPGPDHLTELRSDLAAVERALQRLPRRHHAVLVALRIDEKTRQEVADGYRISLTSVDRLLRQALHYCAEETGQTVMAGITTVGAGMPSRGFLSPRWRAKVAAAEAHSLNHNLDAEKAAQYLIFASLLARRVYEAKDPPQATAP